MTTSLLDQFASAQSYSRAGERVGIEQARADMAAGRKLDCESNHPNGNFRIAYRIAYMITAGMMEA